MWAPPKLVSSCTEATPTRACQGRACRRTDAPTRPRQRRPRGCPRPARQPPALKAATTGCSSTARSPMPTSLRASSPSAAPMSIHSSLSLARDLALLGVGQVRRLLADRPRPPGRPWRGCASAVRPAPSASSRRPRRTTGSRRRRCTRSPDRSRRCGRRRRSSGAPRLRRRDVAGAQASDGASPKPDGVVPPDTGGGASSPPGRPPRGAR